MSNRTDIAFVLVDWGTSHLRLWAVDRHGTVLAEEKSAEGMGATQSSAFEGILNRHLTGLGAGADVPVIMCGMVGSRQGWCEAPYLNIPARLDSVAHGAVRVSGIARDVRILPGIADRRAGAADVMRSEETQLLGLAEQVTDEVDLVCMPGTHSKWVRLSGDRHTVERFATSLSGDLFAALCEHTVLRHSVADASDADLDAFDAATARALANPAQTLMNLFTVRAKVLFSAFGADTAHSVLSGLVIGHDIAGAIERFDAPRRVMLVGGGIQGPLYARALRTAGIGVDETDGDVAARAGLLAAARQIWPHRSAETEPFVKAMPHR